MIVLISDNLYLKVAASCLLNNKNQLRLFSLKFIDLLSFMGDYSRIDRVTFVFDFSTSDYFFINKIVGCLKEILTCEMKNNVVILDRRLKVDSNIGNLYFFHRVDLGLFDVLKGISNNMRLNKLHLTEEISKSEYLAVSTLSCYRYNTNLSSRILNKSIKTISSQKCSFKFKFGFTSELQFYVYIKLILLC